MVRLRIRNSLTNYGFDRPGLTTDPPLGEYEYPLGSIITIVATVEPGYIYEYWLSSPDGAADLFGTENNPTLLLNSDRTIVFTFSEESPPPPPPSNGDSQPPSPPPDKTMIVGGILIGSLILLHFFKD